MKTKKVLSVPERRECLLRFTRAKLILFVVLALPLIFVAGNSPGLTRGKIPAVSSPAITFIENKGQVTDQNMKPRTDVLFSGTSSGMVYHLRNNGVSYQLNQKINENQCEVYRLDVNWLGINRNVTTSTEKPIPGVDHFYKNGKEILGVKTYAGVFYRNIYDHIDLHYYQKDGDLKYDYLVAPHANYKNIRLEIKGAEKITLQNDGSILLKTPLGNILEGAPLVFQSGKKLIASWKIESNVLSFDIVEYNPALPLLIDPATRLWGTYYGTSGAGFLGTNANGCNTDANGNVYMVGITDASAGTGIATSGSHQTTLSTGSGDGFLVKFNAAGTRQFGTYYGGSGGSTRFNQCSVDPGTGEIYAAGFSSSTSGISTSGAHQVAMAQGGDGILIKFTSAGVRQWGTYYGGSGLDEIIDLVVEAGGNIYFTGRASSPNGISTSGSHQFVFGGSPDAMLVKFSSAGVCQWGTYYGGSGGDIGNTVSIDANGNVYLGGRTFSSNDIATSGAYQVNLATTSIDDGFLVKFDNAGVRQWGTYYGGPNGDFVNGSAVDASGNIFLVGHTSSSTSIASPGSYQTTHGGGIAGQPYDAYVVKFSSSGSRLWGTYLGGAGADLAYDCSADPAGNVVLVGQTSSSSGFATTGSHQTTFAGGSSQQPYDAFITKFDGTGSILWSSYYGGPGRDVGSSCAINSAGTQIYLSGSTQSGGGTAIASGGSHQPNMAASNDAFLASFSDCIAPNAPANTTSASNLTLCSGASASLSATGSGPINWFNTPTSTATLGTGGSFTTSLLSSGVHTFYAATSNTCSSSGRTAITITVSPLISLGSGSVCAGKSFTLAPGGVTSFTFDNAPSNGVVTPGATTSYTVQGTDATGCLGKVTNTITVVPLPTITVSNGTICAGSTYTIVPSGAISYTISGGTTLVSPPATQSYSITGTNSAGCSNTTAVVSTVSVNAAPSMSVALTKSVICKGNPAVITASGAVTYSWNTGAVTASIMVTPSITTSYTITGKGTNSCTSKSMITQSVSACSGITGFQGDANLVLFPNPTNGSFKLITSTFENGSIEVYNSAGQLVINEAINSTGNQSYDLSQEANGIYFVRVLENNIVVGGSKLLKQ